mmetsp:Transcript_30923/g.95494  ORF Transcript_30923/g.95494 Transcript_30923/m.95494 type:complete len:332 (-) Transcript_30923:16-1011(-)
MHGIPQSPLLGGRRVLGGRRRATGRSLALLDALQRPVKHVVHLVAFANKEVAEKLLQVRVVGFVLEAQRAVVVQVRSKFVREALAESFNRRRHLLLADAVILLLLRLRLEALPRQRPAQEVDEDVAHGFKVIATGLLDAQMSADAAVARGTRKILALLVWDVLVSLRVAVLLRQAEINDVHMVALLAGAHQEVVRLDVTVQEVLGMHKLDAADHLVSEHQRRLQAVLAPAEVEEVFQRRAEEIDHHDVVVALDTVPPHVRNSNRTPASVENLVKASFVEQLGMTRLARLELDGDRLPRLNVRPSVDVTERTRTDLLADAVLVADAQVHGFQ